MDRLPEIIHKASHRCLESMVVALFALAGSTAPTSVLVASAVVVPTIILSASTTHPH